MMQNDPAGLSEALDGLRSDDFRMGAAWERAHRMAQSREGEAIFDRLHALCHRIEGDSGNAAYWYRRAGVEPFDGSFAEEADLIRDGASR